MEPRKKKWPVQRNIPVTSNAKMLETVENILAIENVVQEMIVHHVINSVIKLWHAEITNANLDVIEVHVILVRLLR